jgi:hypothetical protein
MRILALDQSLTNCGFAVWDDEKPIPVSGAWPLCEGVAQRALAFVDLRRNLVALHKEEPIDIIAHENPLKMPIDKLDKLIGLYGLVAIIEGFCRAKRIRCIGVDARAWRGTWFNGMAITGRDDLKRVAIERARQLGISPLTHDEAEACGILDHVMHREKITPPWRAAHPFVATL